MAEIPACGSCPWEASPVLCLDGPFEDTQPAWSPDSDRLVFATDRSGQVTLWEIDVVSGALRQLTTGPWGWYPNVASTGRVAFDRFDRADLYWAKTSTSSRTTNSDRVPHGVVSSGASVSKRFHTW
jgi:hypothetical protein